MKTKIMPKPKFKLRSVDFADLAIGDWFVFNDMLCKKLPPEDSDNDYQMAIDIADGETMTDMCGKFVLPVVVEIMW